MNEETKEVETPDPAVEALASENQTLKDEIRMRSAIYDIETQFAKAGATSPKLLAAQAKGSFQFGDEGELINSAALIEEVRRTFPEQFGKDRTAGSVNGGAGRSSGPTITKETLSRMTAAEIKQLDWASVRSVLEG